MNPRGSANYGQLSRFLSLKFNYTGVADNSLIDKNKAEPVDSIRDELENAMISTLPTIDDYENSLNYQVIKDDLLKNETRNVNITNDHKKDLDLIKEAFFVDLGLSNNDTFKSLVPFGLLTSNASQLLPGDIIVIRKYGKLSKLINYYACVIKHDTYSLDTFPQISKNNMQNIKYIVRFNNITNKEEVLDKLKAEVGELKKFEEKSLESKWIKPSNPINIDGLLQIGDIKFVVSPTQISFTTQNGYQYFPTIRTNGNPKIPSMQEIKNVNISLIFPNSDTINNQLIPLLAMYMRAPFINLKNSDICNFYSELKDKTSGYIPIALDTIHIESVRGFPNTLQASLSILPFQHKAVGEVFEALRTFRDVRAQQFISIDNDDARITAELDQTLYNKNGSKHSKNLINPTIYSSPNFEDSIPFRSFYQSIIGSRTHVKDDLGNDVYSGNDVIPLSTFRPKREENKLYEYTQEGNKKKIQFRYKYIPENIHEFSSNLADTRSQEMVRIAEETRLMLDAIWAGREDELKLNLHKALIDRQTFYDQMRNYFTRSIDYIQEFMNIHDIDINTPEAKRITSLMELLFEYGSHTFPGTAWLTRSFGNTSGSINKIHTMIDAVRTNNSSYVEPEAFIDILKGVSVWYEGENIGQPIGSVSAKELADRIGDQIVYQLRNVKPIVKTVDTFKDTNGQSIQLKNRHNEQQKWARFFSRLFQSFTDPGIINTLTSDLEVKGFNVNSDIVEIDNQQDVIQGWNIVYTNKFIPIHLQGFKYPYYQHVGSEDIRLNININSIQNNREIGLKEQLALLNDRLQNSTRLVMFNAPELIYDLDPRVYVKVEDNDMGNIFNVFGLKKLVYEGSNVSTVNGKPNNWNIQASFTQSNFELRDYQSISSVPNTVGMEDEIMNLFIRSEKNDAGELVVYKYRINFKGISTFLDRLDLSMGLGEDIQNDFNGLFGIRDLTEFVKTKSAELGTNVGVIGHPDETDIYENPGQLSNSQLKKVNKILISLTFYKNFLKTIHSDYLKQVQKVGRDSSKGVSLSHMSLLYADEIQPDTYFFRKEISNNETIKLRKLLETPELKTIYKNVLNRINELNTQHASILLKSLKVDPTYSEIFLRRQTDTAAFKLLVGTPILEYFKNQTDGFVSNTMNLLVNTTKGGVSAITSWFWLPLDVGATFIEKKIHDGKKSLFDKLSGVIGVMFDTLKLHVIKQISRNIIRDPFIRKKFFGDKFEKNIKKTYSGKGMNCYQDFDIPSNFLKDITGGQDNNIGISFSPDFYLYNKNIDNLEKEIYVKDTIKRSTNIAKIALNLCVLENKEILQKLEAIDELIFDKDDAVRNKIFEELNLLSTGGSKVTPQEGENKNKIFYRNRLEDLQKVYAGIVSEFRDTQSAINPDTLKLNILRSARNKRVIELKTIQTAINMALSGNKITVKGIEYTSNPTNVLGSVFGNKQKEDNIKGSIDQLSRQELEKMAAMMTTYFNIYTGTAKTKDINIKAPWSSDVSKPKIRMFEETIYGLLSQLIMLGDAIAANASNDIDISRLLQEIPEVGMLQWFNWRTIEDISGKQTDLINQFNEENITKTRGHNSRMFPTFKILFVEEDSKLLHDMDDYYSYNAIQSIDVISNKYSASKTAVIKLSNLFGSMTNKITLMRESTDLVSRIMNNRDNLFLGTLDIKPGTKIIIKMGYAANDRYLHPVFVGRIMEMNPGPVCEIVAQSYGAQLNHDITKMHFGVMSTKKEHGDIASAILDSVPSLEGLGKPSTFGINSERFSGREFKLQDSKIFDKFLLSNITSRVNAGMFTDDNPRDENIFLPINLDPNLLHNTTFDWVVYNQTAWQALHELSLYNRNTAPIMRLYNTDIYSTLDDLRETVVIGDKSGFYKYTDSFSFSTLRVQEIQQSVDNWNSKIRGLLFILADFNKQTNDLPLLLTKMVENKYLRYSSSAENGPILGDGKSYYYPTDILIPFMKFVRNKQNVIMLVKKILQSLNYQAPTSVLNYAWDYIKVQFPGVLQKSPQAELIQILLQNAYQGDFDETKATSTPVVTSISSVGAFITSSPLILTPVIRLIELFSLSENINLLSENGALYNINSEDVLHVDAFEPDNNAAKYRNDPRYKHIQQHHLITDTTDIISNNIILSEDFKNAISVYYLPEPKFYSGLGGIDSKDVPDLKAWTIKAFGDTKDSDIRLLETYQKNIDTNWYDMRIAGESVLKRYTRTNNKNFTLDAKPDFTKLPSYAVVALNLLQREVEKMYRGDIRIVGNPRINPGDIVHIDDSINNMNGPIEVEEVIQSITPDGGYTTTIVPALITYDRDPITMNDVGVLENIMKTAEAKRSSTRANSLIKAGLFTIATAFSVADLIGGTHVGGALGTLGFGYEVGQALWDSTVGVEKRYNRFIYDSLANVFGRDCINFSTLFYHGKPYICGFDGVDYTTLKTMINHQWQGLGTVQRLATANDVEYKWIINQGNLDKVGPLSTLVKDSLTDGSIIDKLWSTIFSENFGKNGSNYGTQLE